MTDQSKPILIMDDKTRANLKASLDALAEAEKPISQLMDPLRKASAAIQGVRGLLLEQHGVEEIVGECGTCELPIFEGERGFKYEDGPMFCATHFPSWAECKAEWDETTKSPGFWENEDPEEGDDSPQNMARNFQNSYDAHVTGGGSPDDKVLYTL